MPVCQKCGKEAPPAAAVCSTCGAVLTQRKPNLAGTMLGMPSPVAPGKEGAHPQQQAPSASGGAPADGRRAALAGTVIGMPSPLVTGQARRDPEPSPAAPQSPALGKTMLGMGSPIAKSPLGAAASPGAVHSPMETANQPSAAARPEHAATPQQNKFKGTLLGIAQPGIAPSHTRAPAPPSVAQSNPSASNPAASNPAASRSLSSRPAEQRFPTTRPVWQKVAFVVGGMALAAGIGGSVALFAPKPVVITVDEFAIDEEGNDQLHLSCERCPNGSALILGDAKAEVNQGKATLKPMHPLALGRNELKFQLKDGDSIRDAKKVILPIAFRVLTRWTGLHDEVPYAEVTVAAPDGSKVSIDGDEVPVRNQKVTHRVTFEKETLGESAKVQQAESQVDIVVIVDGEPRNTKAELRSGITPLSLHSPSPVHHLGGKPVSVTGRTAPRAIVTSGDLRVEADDQGSFSFLIESPREGKLIVTAQKEEFLLRRVELEFTSNAPVPEGAVTTFEGVEPGAQVNLVANVIESRTDGGTTRALVEVERGCSAPPCLLRAVYGEPKKLPPNRAVRLTGVVTAGNPLTVRVRRFR